MFALAAPQPAPAAATLPEAELKEGWIGLFDGESLYGWQTLGGANWHVADGAIVCADGSSGMIATTSQFADFELTLEIRVTAHEPPPPPRDEAQVEARARQAGKNAPAPRAAPRTSIRAEDCTAGIALRSPFRGHNTDSGAGHILVHGVSEGDGWQTIKVLAAGDTYKADVNGQEYPGHDFGRGRGHIGFQYHPAKRSKVEIRKIKLRPLGTAPIFNGKDLTGWVEMPERKSEFSVVDGALNIRNGNGEIKTTGLYKDFALQLEAISHGDHLNSGVFYRGTPDLFWSGYEIQIRNEWRDGDRTQPVDYGTGGNYGNEQARAVVSTDREWFYMTLICTDNHAAAWINGYLASDFLDCRPMGETARFGRFGYEPGPGTISLQGHDPGTDLSFRNIEIVEFPAP